MYAVVSVLFAIMVVARSSLLVSTECILLENIARCGSIPSKDRLFHLNDTVMFLYISQALGEVQEGSFQTVRSLVNLEMYSGITYIQPGAFEGLTSLTSMNLFNNSIERIDRGTFEGCTSLKTLVLGRNKIKHIEANAFQDLSSLTFLDLSYNPDIKVFSDHIFNGLPELVFLQCVSCGLNTIQPLAFEGLPKCNGLNLRLNNLKEVSGTEFELLPELKELNLSSNNITRIDIDTLLSNHANLKSLMLRYNPFSCDDMTDIEQEGQIKGVTINILAYGEDTCKPLLTAENSAI